MRGTHIGIEAHHSGVPAFSAWSPAQDAASWGIQRTIQEQGYNLDAR